MSTFGQLKDEVIFNTFDGAKYLERAGVYLNNAARDVARRSAWGATVSPAPVTETDQWTGAAPSPVDRVTGVWSADPQGRRLDRYVFAGDMGSPSVPARRDLLDVADPSYVTRTGDGGELLLVVSPVPASGQLVVSGTRVPAALAAAGDVVELGEEAEDAMILFARAKLYLREDDKEMHDALMQSYLEELRRFTLATRPVVDGPRVTPGTWGDGTFGEF